MFLELTTPFPTLSPRFRQVLHRDLKPQNVLISAPTVPGQPPRVVLADFGLGRTVSHPHRAYSHEVGASSSPFAPLPRTLCTPARLHALDRALNSLQHVVHVFSQIVTLWYRPPEILMGDELYRDKVDVWSVGCIFSECATVCKLRMMNGVPIQPTALFPGHCEIDQMYKIFQLLGTPTEATWEGVSRLYVPLTPQGCLLLCTMPLRCEPLSYTALYLTYLPARLAGVTTRRVSPSGPPSM